MRVGVMKLFCYVYIEHTSICVHISNIHVFLYILRTCTEIHVYLIYMFRNTRIFDMCTHIDTFCVPTDIHVYYEHTPIESLIRMLCTYTCTTSDMLSGYPQMYMYIMYIHLQNLIHVCYVPIPATPLMCFLGTHKCICILCTYTYRTSYMYVMYLYLHNRWYTHKCSQGW